MWPGRQAEQLLCICKEAPCPEGRPGPGLMAVGAQRPSAPPPPEITTLAELFVPTLSLALNKLLDGETRPAKSSHATLLPRT